MADSQHQTVSLGCGTLIFIAIIVLFFGNAGSNKETENRLQTIEQRLGKIEQQLNRIEGKVGK